VVRGLPALPICNLHFAIRNFQSPPAGPPLWHRSRACCGTVSRPGHRYGPKVSPPVPHAEGVTQQSPGSRRQPRTLGNGQHASQTLKGFHRWRPAYRVLCNAFSVTAPGLATLPRVRRTTGDPGLCCLTASRYSPRAGTSLPSHPSTFSLHPSASSFAPPPAAKTPARPCVRPLTSSAREPLTLVPRSSGLWRSRAK
jgi:hypothetical protein